MNFRINDEVIDPYRNQLGKIFRIPSQNPSIPFDCDVLFENGDVHGFYFDELYYGNDDVCEDGQCCV